MIRVTKRLGLMVLVIWLAASINFLLPRLTDRDPIEERLRVSVRATIEAVFEEELDSFL